MARATTVRERHPELFLPDQNIDRGKCKREVPMRVLSLGMPRTGTASMQLALNILGIPTYHGISLFANISDTTMWATALDAKFFPSTSSSTNPNPSTQTPPFTRTEWDRLLGHFSAVTDLPAVAFAEDLIAAYPEAKVVLVERDIESWYRSFDEGIIQAVWNPVMRFLSVVDTRFVGKLGSVSMRWTRGWIGANSKAEMQERARPLYREHYALVRKVTPSERLLEFRLEEGWGPLCKFLGVEMPDIPFPRVNEAEALKEKIGLIARRGAWKAVGAVARVVVPLVVMGVAVYFGNGYMIASK